MRTGKDRLAAAGAHYGPTTTAHGGDHRRGNTKITV